MTAKSSNIFTCPKKILEKSRAKILGINKADFKVKALKIHKHLMYINKKFLEHRCCSTKAKRQVKTVLKKKKWKRRNRLVSMSSSKKKKKRKKKGRSKKSSKKKCGGKKKKKSCKKN